MMEINKLALINRIKPKLIFEYEGLLVGGNPEIILKKYIEENPDKKFRTWLMDNAEIINR